MVPDLSEKKKKKTQVQHNRKNPWVESQFAEQKSLSNLVSAKETITAFLTAFLKLYTARA